MNNPEPSQSTKLRDGFYYVLLGLTLTDVREILHTTLILRTQGGDAAEAAFKRIHHPNTPYARGIRYKIIEEQLRSGFINPIKKQALISEKSELETQKMFDILNQLQCYDGD